MSSGTTTCSYYATIHKEASLLLAKICAQRGQRCLIGKVSMDNNSPKYYRETTSESKMDNQDFLNEIEKLGSSLVTACITPRFAPSCTSELMGFLGNLADKEQVPIQTHISENKKEIEWVLDLFKDCESYADVYYQHKLLNSRTILAHAVHLTESELELIKKQQCGISHCPLSNFMLTSGVLDVENLHSKGIEKIGLGSDCAGGYTVSIMEQMRQAIIASKVVKIINNHQDSNKEKKGVNCKQAFYMATLGGAKVLNMESKIGNFQIGKQFDALIVNNHGLGITQQQPNNHNVNDLFEKLIMLGQDTNISRVFVDGKRVV